MVTPFLTLQQLSMLFSRPSTALMRDSQAPASAMHELFVSEEEEQGKAMAVLAQEPPHTLKNAA